MQQPAGRGTWTALVEGDTADCLIPENIHSPFIDIFQLELVISLENPILLALSFNDFFTLNFPPLGISYNLLGLIGIVSGTTQWLKKVF